MDGIDPITGEVLPKDHLCQNADVIRALHSAVLALSTSDAENPEVEQSIYLQKKNGRLNAGRFWTEEDNQQLISLYLENVPMDEICYILQRRPRGVYNQLTYLGFDPATLKECSIKETKSTGKISDKRGKPWTHVDHKWMVSAWEEGSTITEMAEYLGRTPHAVRLRLERYGLYDGGMTAKDEPPPWTANEQQELFRMVDAGCTIAEMAQKFGRTEQAMEARLFYLGLSKKTPKLF